MLKVIKKATSLRKELESHFRKKIGFVPTMGAFHEGHLSLMRKARKSSDVVVVSLFVNPMQFGKSENLSKYPKQIKRDIALAMAEGVDYIYIPSVDEIYPEGYSSMVEVDAYRGILCDGSRPGHFVGVTTVVAKLLNIVNPDVSFFGQKDYQQYLLIKKMVADLNFKSKVVICPIVRDLDGMAMSSRNAYLSKKNRERAVSVSIALKHAKKIVLKKSNKPSEVVESIKGMLEQSVDSIDYIALLKAEDLSPVKVVRKGKYFIGVAANIGKTRLIDNVLVNVK